MTPLERRAQVEELWTRRIIFADAMNEARLTNFRGRWLGFYAAELPAQPDMVWTPRPAADDQRPGAMRMVRYMPHAFAEALSP